MSDLDRTLDERIHRYRPASPPPFAVLTARRRRRLAMRSGVTGVAVLCLLGGAAAVSAHQPGQPDTLRPLVPPTARAATSQPPDGWRQRPGPADRAAHELWTRKGARDYTFTVVRTCYCVGGGRPASVTVRGGAVYPPVSDHGNGSAKSIDDLFDIILTGKADRFTVRYDPTYGYPAELQLDYTLNAIDDEMAYTITGYRPR